MGGHEEAHGRVCAFARGKVQEADIEDAAQEAVLRVIQTKGHEEVTPSYYIKTAHNYIKRVARRRETEQKCAERKSRELAPIRMMEFDSVKIPRIDFLSKKKYEALRCVLSGMTYSQTALALGSKVSDVTNWVHRALIEAQRENTDENR